MIIHHANCADGWVAAWAVQVGTRDSDWVAAQYGEPPPDVTGRDVVIVDFSYPRAVLLEMKEKAKSLLVLDHHKAAEADLAELDFCKFDQNMSGAAMAWREFMPGKNVPWLVRYVMDRDLWQHRLKYTKEINAWIRGEFPLDFHKCQHMDAVLESIPDGGLGRFHEAVNYGEGALAVVDTYISSMNDLVRFHDFSLPCGPVGHSARVAVVNCAPWSASELLGHLCDISFCAFAIGYFQRQDGMWQYSLRSRGECGADVSEIAKRFGGGGHKNAAGFESDLSFDELMTSMTPSDRGC